MWRIGRISSLYPITNHNLFTVKILLLSRTLSKSPQLSRKKTPPPGSHPENIAINSLFKEITEVLGSDCIVSEEIPFRNSIYKQNDRRDGASIEQLEARTEGVCGNVQPNNKLKGENTERNVSDETRVSSVVGEITKIVRAHNGAVPMEERLESLEFQFSTQIVENVLKRCFKVPQLAYRFFNWVKTKDGFCHDTRTYNTILYIIGETKETELAERLVEEMEENYCEMDIKTWTILIWMFGKAKLIGKALFYFEKMKKSGFEPDEKLYRTMLHCLCNAGKGDIAMELYKEMGQRELRLDLNSIKLLSHTMAKSGDISAAMLVADELIRLSLMPERDVRVCMLKSFCIGGRIREALELIREFKSKDIAIDYECFETLLKGLCRADRISDALELVEIMKRKNLVDSKVYGIIINGYLKRKELSKAMELFESMKESGYQPTTSTYTELMQNLFNLDEYREGFQLYNEMLERGIEADSVAITAVVAGHVRQNRISEAWETFNSMQSKGIKPTWKSYSIFIKELCKISRTDELLKVLHKMQSSKINIDDRVFKWVIVCMEKNGEMEKIKEVRKMQKICSLEPQEDAKSREHVLELELKPDQPEQERTNCQLLRPLSKGYNEQDLQEICQILTSSEDWRNVEQTLENCPVQFTPELVLEVLRNSRINGKAALQFFSWVGMRTGYRHTTETYNMAMKISGRGKDFHHMRSLFYEMRRKGCEITADTWTIMIMQYGRTGLTEIALKFFDEMKDKGYNPTESTYKCMIISLCGPKGRKADEAVRIFHEMIRAGHVPDRETAETYLRCLCETNKLSEARKSADSLIKVGFSAPLSSSIHIRALSRAGKLEEALSLLDQAGTERSTLNEYTYATFVHGLLRKGREEEALAKIESMRKAGVNPSVHVYTSLIVHFLKGKNVEKAMAVLEEMQREGCEPTIVTYSALIRGYVEMGRARDAWNVFDDLKEKGLVPDFKMYSMFINCLCKAGKSEESIRLLSEMLENGNAPSSVNFRTVFYGLNREGKHDLAQKVLQQKYALRSKRKLPT